MPLKLVPPIKGRTHVWYVRGTIYGRTIFASTKARDKKVAQRFKERLELALAKEDQQKHEPASFGIAAEMYKNMRHPDKEDVANIDRLTALIGSYLLSDIRQHTLIEAANELHPRGSASTKNRSVLVPASAILHYAAENNLCPFIRVRKFREKAPEPRAASREVRDLLIASTTGQMRALIVWLFFQGWRVSDALALQWQDVDLGVGTVKYHVRKTDDWRVMPLHARTIEALMDLGRGAGRVFHWTDKSNLYRDLRPICRQLGVHFTPHMARHSFATWLANEGVSPLEIMEAGGWKDHKSVMRYAKLDPTRVRKTISKIV